jgi:Na+/melibiose symporter-like transporter
MTLFDRVVSQTSALAKKGDARLPRSPFGRVGVTEAAESAGDALVALALAGSLFFSLDPNAAKSKVLQYLLISLAPFVVVAPFIGPLVDRLGHARKWVLFGSLVTRALICLFMAGHLRSLLLFPEAFAVLVSGKTASVAKSAMVPAVVPSDNELVRANARLSLISVFGGGVILPIGWVIRRFGEEGWVLRSASLVFIAAAVVSLRIRVRPERSGPPGSNESFSRVIADDGPVRVNALAMALLRGSVGCVMFASVFALRDKPLWVTGLTLGSLQAGTSLGAAIAEKLRRRTHEARMVLGAMMLVAVVAGVSAIFPTLQAGVAVAATVGIAASTSRLAFDAIVQRSLPRHDFGAAFARYETRFQLSWVVGALVPTALVLPRSVGFGLVSAVMVFGVIVGRTGS